MFCQPDRQWHVFLLLASPTLISIFYTTHPKLRGSDPISSNSSNSSHLQIQSVVTSCLPSYVESSLRESSSTFFFVIFPVAFLTFLGAITHRLAATTPHIHLVQQLQMCKNTFVLWQGARQGSSGQSCQVTNSLSRTKHVLHAAYAYSDVFFQGQNKSKIWTTTAKGNAWKRHPSNQLHLESESCKTQSRLKTQNSCRGSKKN